MVLRNISQTLSMGRWEAFPLISGLREATMKRLAWLAGVAVAVAVGALNVPTVHAAARGAGSIPMCYACDIEAYFIPGGGFPAVVAYRAICEEGYEVRGMTDPCILDGWDGYGYTYCEEVGDTDCGIDGGQLSPAATLLGIASSSTSVQLVKFADGERYISRCNQVIVRRSYTAAAVALIRSQTASLTL